MRYTVVIEKGKSSFGAFVPDIPGCIAAGETREDALDLIQEAIQFHIEGLQEEGKTIAAPRCDFAHVEVPDSVLSG